MNGDNDEGICDRKLIHTSWRGMGPHQFAGIHRGREYDAPEYNGYFVTYPS